MSGYVLSTDEVANCVRARAGLSQVAKSHEALRAERDALRNERDHLKECWETSCSHVAECCDILGAEGMPDTWALGEQCARVANENADLHNRLAASEARAEQLQVQLAGCGVASMGGTTPPVVATREMYGWSASYQGVLDLRIAHDELQARAARLEAISREVADYVQLEDEHDWIAVPVSALDKLALALADSSEVKS